VANRVRITGGDIDGVDNEGIDAKVDENNRLCVSSTPGTVSGGVTSESLNQTYEDDSFISSDSPQSHNFNSDAGRNSVDGWIICDGAGDIQVDYSPDGITFGDKWTMKTGEVVNLSHLNIHTIRITYVSQNSAYRIFLV